MIGQSGTGIVSLRNKINVNRNWRNNESNGTVNEIPGDKGSTVREGANKRGNSSRLTQSFHFFMFEPIFSPVNALNQPI
ncbi:hypothetical protein, partial [Klebsiella grimontii]|uniref:hypothetical protein n=1 Tax=Klebsiella grimontii TaxID=2058152 RepID=UPI001C497FCD